MATNDPDDARQRTRHLWNLAAPGYRRWERHLFSQMHPMTERLIHAAGILPGHTVLDVATGIGEPALTIAKHVGPQGRVVGVDISPDMVAIAKERARAQGLENVAFHVNHDETLSEFPDATFDAIVSRFGLMFLPNPLDALRAFRRVLKPRGNASVTVPGTPDKTPFLSLPMKIIAQHVPSFTLPLPDAPGFYAISSLPKLRQLFRTAEFSHFHGQTLESGRLNLESAEEYWDMITEINGALVIALATLPDATTRRIKEDVLATLTRMYPSGPPELQMEVIIGTGSKL